MPMVVPWCLLACTPTDVPHGDHMLGKMHPQGIRHAVRWEEHFMMQHPLVLTIGAAILYPTDNANEDMVLSEAAYKLHQRVVSIQHAQPASNQHVMP